MTPLAAKPELEALTGLLGRTIDPVNQFFFHSRMLRAWGHRLGAAHHHEWIEKMRRSRRLGALVIDRGGLPPDRPASDINIGKNAADILANDCRLGEQFLSAAKAVLEQTESPDGRALVTEIIDAESADIERLSTLSEGPEAHEPRQDRRHLMPKPGHDGPSIAAIDTLLPGTTSAVSQIFLHSMVAHGRSDPETSARELQAALRMMYRSEALLERMIDLGGVPSGQGHGAIVIDATNGGADRTAASVHRTLLDSLDCCLPKVDPHGDPTTWTLLDGLRHALRDEAETVAARLAH